MANNSQIKALINEKITTNGTGAITGSELNNVLIQMVLLIGEGRSFAGIATPSGTPSTYDRNVFWLATQAGTYTNFGNAVIPNGLTIIRNNESGWQATTLMTIDATPTENSINLLTSGGAYAAIALKQDALTFDSAPKNGSNNPVVSGGVYTAIQQAIAAITAGTTEIYDASSAGTTYATLAAALAVVPSVLQKGGMSVKYIDSTTSKYVQYRLTKTTWSTTASDWEESGTAKLYTTTGNHTDGAMTQKAVTDLVATKQDSLTFDNAPTASSTNPVTSGGVVNSLATKHDKIYVVSHGTSDATFALTPNVFHVWSVMPSLTLTFATPSDNTILNRYMFQFVSGSTPTTLSLPSGIMGASVTIAANKVYQFVIINNVAQVVEVDSMVRLVEGTFLSRTTAGGLDLAKPTATLLGIKGNTLVWNQRMPSSSGSATASGVTVTKDGYKYTFSGTTTEKGVIGTTLPSTYMMSGHKYYCHLPHIDGCTILNAGTGFYSGTADSFIFSNSATAYKYLQYYATSVGLVVNASVYVFVCDLTQMFGEGNEPTIEEFKAMFPLDYYDNNSGALLNNNATSLVSKDSENNTLDTITLNIPTLTGKLNGEGDSVTIFADGMKSAGSVYDEIYKENGVWKAIKRIGNVDLGTLTWYANTSLDYATFNAPLTNLRAKSPTTYAGFANFVAAKYIAGSAQDTYNGDATIFIRGAGTGYVFVNDSSYSTAAAFKTAMSGVYMNYEYYTPRVYVLDDELQELLNVATGGTESILPENGSAPTTAPAPITMEYIVND